MTSWRTTVCGVLAALVGGINCLVIPWLDGNPATTPDWVAFGTIFATAVGLAFARDNRVTSEQTGAK